MSVHLTAITVPKWGLTMEEGVLTAWHVAEGDTVTKGQEVADVETSKIAGAVEAPATGLVGRIVAQAGQSVRVGALLAVIVEGDSAAGEVEAFVSGFASTATGTDGRVAAPQPQMVEIAGQGWRYLATGPHDDGKLPILLLHGLFGDLDSWMFVRDRLAAERRVVTLDLPGHGGSSKDVGAGTLDSLADMVTRFADAIELRRAHVVGHSLGAAIALRIASRDSSRVASLVTIAGLGYGAPVDRGFVRGMLDARRARDLRPAAEMLFADPALVTREFLENIVKLKRVDGVAATLEKLAHTAMSAPETEHLAALREPAIPMLAIIGERDRIIEPPISIPAGVEIVRLPVGHMVHLEAPADVSQAITNFLKDKP